MSADHGSSSHFVVAASLLFWFAALVIGVFPNKATAQDGVSPDSESISVNYTGALFGYYRIEADGSVDSLKPSPNPLDRFLQQNSNGSLLLGMGDNFGPEFGSGVQLEFRNNPDCYLPANSPQPGHKNIPPEILYKNEDRMPRLAECDNVARFLMRAGYRAIVPGKEDFLYSARWLRRMALLLQVESDPNKKQWSFADDRGRTNALVTRGHNGLKINNKDAQLLMLAANLRLNFAVEGLELGLGGVGKQEMAKRVKGICPLLFNWAPLGSIATADAPQASEELELCVSGGSVTKEMDWLRRLDLTVDDAKIAESMNRQAKRDATFRKQLLENQAQIVLATLNPQVCTNQCLDLQKALTALGGDDSFETIKDESAVVKLSSEGERQSKQLAKIKGILSPDLELTVSRLVEALGKLDGQQSDAEFLMPTQARQAAIRLLLRRIAKEQKDIGYTIVAANGSTPATLVIGVVGQETMKAVSPINLKLCTDWKELRQQAYTEDLSACNERVAAKEPRFVSQIGHGRVVGTVSVGDPALAVTATLRAAWEKKKEEPFERIVVMAQMPNTEAEELAAQVRISLARTGNYAQLHGVTSRDEEGNPHVDVILSEAQVGHASPELELHYERKRAIPVVTPTPAWTANKQQTALVEPLSVVTIERNAPVQGRVFDRIIVNKHQADANGPNLRQRESESTDSQPARPDPTRTMAQWLEDELDKQKESRDLGNLRTFWSRCGGGLACQNSVMMQYLLEQIQRKSHADVVLLENRDFYFGPLLPGYERYDTCTNWVNDHPDTMPLVDYCRLRIALDRVLWKGDFAERVMVDGKSLKSMLATAQQETEDEQTLAARDTVNEWLMTFGLVTEPAKNLSAASMGPDTFAVPGVGFCKDLSGEGAPPFCINGVKVSDDGAYWISTNDHLAQDKQIYKVLAGLDRDYHEPRVGLYITGEIADEIYNPRPMQKAMKISGSGDAQAGMRKEEELQQARPILQLDYAKVVAEFMLHKPSLSDAQLASEFAGVTDSRATTPHAQELDLEAAARMTRGLGSGEYWRRAKAGLQSDLQYDRAVTGNLTGSPETVTLALNSFTVGGFLQYRLSGENTLPRLLLVTAPYQHQQQVTGNFLNFKFSSGSEQIKVATPRWEGFSQRIGLRYEFGGGKWPIPDPGSYVEAGPEYSDINNVLSGLLLPNGIICAASTVPFATCVAANTTITASTALRPLTETLHTGGAYWDAHLQKAIDKAKRSSVTIESKGDRYILPGKTLPTQSRYAFTTTGSLNFAVIGNLTFSPTLTTFFYRNQGTPAESHSLLINTFSVTAKWYFGRDAAVPFWHQLRFRGPASLDQTKSARMK